MNVNKNHILLVHVKLHISETERTIGSICRELNDIRDGTAFCMLTPTESSQLVNSLSTS